MTENPYSAFIHLVTIDRDILDSQKKSQKISNEIATLTQELEQKKAQIEDIHRIEHDLRKKLDEKELEIRHLRDQEKIKKEKLDSATNPKEYLSLEHELGTLNKKQQIQEDLLLGIFEAHEQADALYKTKNTEFLVQQKQLQEQIAERQKHVTDLSHSIHELLQKRVAYEPLVNIAMLEQYNSLKSRVDNPVVPVINESCSACFYRIPPNDINLLKRHKLLSCKDCYRLLYLPE